MAFCTRCGAHLPDHARFCPACGKAAAPDATDRPSAPDKPEQARSGPARSASAPLPPLRRGGGGGLSILGAMIVVALVVIGLFLWSQRDGTRPIAGSGSGPATEATRGAGDAAPADAARTTVAALDAAFIADPAGARRRYDGPVTVSGTIVSVTSGGNPSLSLEGRTRFNHVVANVVDGSAFTDVARGDRVTLACGGVTALAGTTILQDCTPA